MVCARRPRRIHRHRLRRRFMRPVRASEYQVLRCPACQEDDAMVRSLWADGRGQVWVLCCTECGAQATILA